ncbi:MAG: FAD-dependent oxidoreductase [Alphaproteobacteria bacterium]|nr:FAD-dependent oxidoreductase [Alphaproteobacteria bacterium]
MTRRGGGAGHVHVVGAGLAGLAAAAALAEAGHDVALYESADHAGGRCRSYFDSELGIRLDNGNHLLLSGNRSALAYLRLIGAMDTFEPAGEAAIPFVDLASGARWSVRPNRGWLPWWVLVRSRRVPGSGAREYLAALRLRDSGPDDTIAARLDRASSLYRRLWGPLAVAALNTAVEAGSARLMWRILAETLGRGAAACRPLAPRQGLSESFVEPALAMLQRRGATIRFGARLREMLFDGPRVAALRFDREAIAVAAADRVVLAVPAPVAARLVPGLVVPDDHAPIVNAHYRLAPPPQMPLLAGLVGGTAEWVFGKPDAVSVTVSAADAVVDRPAGELAATLWQDVARAFDLPAAPVPPYRIVKERRATFRATPAQLRRRPPTGTQWNNLLLAGDYVDTGLPATIEGAIRSGLAAAGAIVRLPGARAAGGRDHRDSIERSDATRFGADASGRDRADRARQHGGAGDALVAVAAA